MNQYSYFKNKETRMKFLKDQLISQLDLPDANGNIWSSEGAKKAINEYQKLKVKERRALGELDHAIKWEPWNGFPRAVNLNNVSHQITNLKIEDNILIGDIKILDTPSGEILQKLIDVKIPIYLTVRATGTVEKDEAGNNIITKADIISFDVLSVAQPSNTRLQALIEKIRKFNIYGEEIEND